MVFTSDIYACGNNPKYFIKHFCYTFDEHDDSVTMKPKPFPVDEREYFDDLIDLWEEEYYKEPGCGKVAHPKSRQMMLTWTAGAYALWRAGFRSNQRILIQSKTLRDAVQILNRVKIIYTNLDPEIQKHCELTKNIELQREDSLKFKNGSIVLAIPEGGPIVLSNTPSVLIMDEIQNMDEAEEAYASAAPCAKLIIMIGTPGPGFFQRLVEDTDGEINLPEVA